MNPYRIWSLHDLLLIYAPRFVGIGQMYENYTKSVESVMASPTALPSDQQLTRLINLLTDLRAECLAIKLPVSARSLEKAILDFKRQRPTHEFSQQRFSEWFNCFNCELESRMFLLVFPHRQPYASLTLPSKEIGGEEIVSLLNVLDRFSDAHYDAREAGNCYAFERFTACIYHLMRVAEYGLVSVARDIKISEDKVGKGWDGCIQGIQSAIKAIESTKPTTDWQEQVKKYSDLCSWFTTIKTGWRNPVSHIPRIYLEASALEMFSAVKTLFEHLNSYGFQQVPMPTQPISPPMDGD